MKKTRRVYSPVMRRELVTRLYFAAKAYRCPMTVLMDRIVSEALDRMIPVPIPEAPEEEATRVAA